MISIEGTVELEIIDYINFSKLQCFERVAAAANNPDEVHHLEEVLMIWYRQIEQVGCYFNTSIQYGDQYLYETYMKLDEGFSCITT